MLYKFMTTIKESTYIYVLKLKENKWYVGRTNRKPEERFLEHLQKAGSAWTKTYEVLKLHESIEGDVYDEDKYTLKYMYQYGIQNVRGGSWVLNELTESDIEQIVKSLRNSHNQCFECGSTNHIATKCPSLKDDIGVVYCNDGTSIMLNISKRIIFYCDLYGKINSTPVKSIITNRNIENVLDKLKNTYERGRRVNEEKRGQKKELEYAKSKLREYSISTDGISLKKEEESAKKVSTQINSTTTKQVIDLVTRNDTKNSEEQVANIKPRDTLVNKDNKAPIMSEILLSFKDHQDEEIRLTKTHLQKFANRKLMKTIALSNIKSINHIDNGIFRYDEIEIIDDKYAKHLFSVYNAKECLQVISKIKDLIH